MPRSLKADINSSKSTLPKDFDKNKICIFKDLNVDFLLYLSYHLDFCPGEKIADVSSFHVPEHNERIQRVPHRHFVFDQSAPKISKNRKNLQ